MLLTLLAYLALAILAIVVIGIALLPVYLWVWVRDARLIAQAQADMAEAQAILAEPHAQH